MSALAARRLPVLAEPLQPRLFALPGGREDEPRAAVATPPAPAPAPQATAAATVVSLDTALTAAWSALAVGDAAACLVCGGEMAPRWTASSGPVGGRCRSCGSTLE